METAKLDREIRDMTEQMKNLAQETSEVTRKLQQLTQHTVDDSAVVSVITIVSAIYLPGSFVGVSISFAARALSPDNTGYLTDVFPDYVRNELLHLRRHGAHNRHVERYLDFRFGMAFPDGLDWWRILSSLLAKEEL